MNRIGLTLYWLICCYIVSNLLFISDGLMFVDYLSLTTVIVPTIGAWFIKSDIAVNERLRTCLKVCWLSGGLLFTYGLISILGNFSADYQGMAAGVSVALLPIIYCFVISLFCAPIVFSRCS